MSASSTIVSIAAAIPRIHLPSEHEWRGHRLELTRLFAALSACLSALILWMQERYFFARLTWLRLIWDNVLRARTLDIILTRHKCSAMLRLSAAVLRLAWFYYLSRYVPMGMRMMIDTGVTKFIPAAFASFIVYLQSDCPPGKEQASFRSQFDATLGFFLFTYGIHQPKRLLGAAYRIVFWTGVLVLNWACEWNYSILLSTTLLGFDVRKLIQPMVDWLPSGTHFVGRIIILSLCSILLRKVEFHSFKEKSPAYLSRIPFIIVLKLSSLLEAFEFVEAFILVYIPRWIERQIYQYQRTSRQLNGVDEYQFTRLRPGEIRLLVLKRSRYLLSGTPEAEVIEVPFTMLPHYEALSYRWEDEILSEEILANGHVLKVTKSAFEVLLAHRSSLTDRTIWIDAICINQMDQAEKGEQVQIMSQIYRTASRVVIFPFNRWSARLAVPLIYQYGLGPKIEPLEAQASKLQDILTEGLPSFVPRWEAFAGILSHEYFSRAWIVQEIAVAQKVHLSLGGLYVPWEVFFEATRKSYNQVNLAKLHNKSFGLQADSLKIHCVHLLNALRPGSLIHNTDTYRAYDELTSLESILYITSMFQCTDPIDKVYSVLGIMSENDSSLSLRPDYSRSPEEVFEAIAYHLLCRAQPPSINILAFAGCGYPDRKQENRTWIPQLQSQRTRHSYTQLLLRKPRFRACGNTLATITEADIPGSLCITGNVCDKIYAISPAKAPEAIQFGGSLRDPSSVNHPGRRLMIEMVNFINAALAFTHHHETHGPVRPKGALCHALTTDSMPDTTEETFQKWLKNFQLVQLFLADGEYDTTTDADTASKSSSTPAKSPRQRESENQKEAESDKRFRTIYEQLGSDPGFIAYLSLAVESCDRRRIGLTRHGRLCLIPPLTQVGDTVFVPCGAQTPYILRQHSEFDGCYVLVGETYVQGIMQGEAMIEGEAESEVEDGEGTKHWSREGDRDEEGVEKWGMTNVTIL